MNAKDDNDKTAFVKAYQRGHTDIIKLFLCYSDRNIIDINGKGVLGRTSFFDACKYGHTDIVKLMLDRLKAV